MHVSNVSRAAGSSAVASASYITSQKMRDERLGLTSYGYGRRERVEHVGTMLPAGAPEEWNDPERLFNAVEAAERRVDARPAKKIMVALPREFDAENRIRAVEDFIALNLACKGYAVTYAIHTDQQGNNPHAHILVANRRIDPKTGKWAAKSRSEFALDANGQRIPVIDPATGRQKVGARNRKQWKRVTVSNNPLDSKEFLEKLRADWATQCNLMLPDGVRIDHRSLEAQGIDRLPTIHEGYAARDITKRGGHSILTAINDRIRAANRHIADLKAKVREIGRQLERLTCQVCDDIGDAFDGMRIVRTRHPDRLLHDLNKPETTANVPVTVEQAKTAPEPAPETKKPQKTPQRAEQAQPTPEPTAKAEKPQDAPRKPETAPEEPRPAKPAPEPRKSDAPKTLEEQLEDAKRLRETIRQRLRDLPSADEVRVQEILEPAHDAALKAENANPFTRGLLRRKAEQTAERQSALRREALPWLEDTRIPATYAEIDAFHDRTDKAIADHVLQPYEERVRDIERQLVAAKVKARATEMLWEKGERTERKPIRTRGDLSSAFRAKLKENLRNAEESCQPQRPHRGHNR